MSARKHVSDAKREAARLHIDVLALNDALSMGHRVTTEQVAHLISATRFIAAQLAMADHDLERIPQVDEVPPRRVLPNGQTVNVGRAVDDPPIAMLLRDLQSRKVS